MSPPRITTTPLVSSWPLAGPRSPHWPPLPPYAIVSHTSAAALHDLPIIRGLSLPELTVPRGTPRRTVGWQSHWIDLLPDDVTIAEDGTPVTSRLRTVLDCCRTMDLLGAVAILDCALRRQWVGREELDAAARVAVGRGAQRLRKAVRWSDGRADSAQESVGRVALGLAGLPSVPQYVLNAGPLTHPYDLGLPWCKCVVDLQSRKHHSEWSAVVRDMEHLDEVNLTDGWKLIWTTPEMVLPDPSRFVRRVMSTALRQPGVRSRRLSRIYLDDEGRLSWPDRLDR